MHLDNIKQLIKRCIKEDDLYWKEHFLQRIRTRNIRINQIYNVLDNFEIIDEYEDDRPFPSYLILGFTNSNPIHIVIGINEEDREIHMITAYKPDTSIWENDFKTRKK